MGWTSSSNWQRKEEIVAHVTSSYLWGNNFNILEHSVRGSRVWVLAEYTDNHPERAGERFIALFLLDKFPEGWAYKDMDESMGPFHHDCPISFLTRAEEVAGRLSDTAKKWRQQVRDYHTAQRQKQKALAQLSPDTIVRFQNVDYKLLEKLPRRLGWKARSMKDGQIYRMMAKQVSQAVVIPPPQNPPPAARQEQQLAFVY
ncbi:hypothetical protein IC617_08560 [Neiella sp. HB171785]|uniref:Uncharacterized protein n=1 Tax=Neiella litorisoli TaxID=2771431 RepID=A0A8J6UPU1_9GAMM|nr:hypothetical protein [Neiella litorisoli]MBD1389477.1 hypothetical protein [Neiella litorisoli]